MSMPRYTGAALNGRQAEAFALARSQMRFFPMESCAGPAAAWVASTASRATSATAKASFGKIGEEGFRAWTQHP